MPVGKGERGSEAGAKVKEYQKGGLSLVEF